MAFCAHGAPWSSQQRASGARSVCCAVVDKYGFLWTGAGDYQWGATLTNPGQANSSSLSGGQYGVLRIPVGAVAGTGLGNYINSGNPTFFPVTHETNVRLPARAWANTSAAAPRWRCRPTLLDTGACLLLTAMFASTAPPETLCALRHRRSRWPLTAASGWPARPRRPCSPQTPGS